MFLPYAPTSSFSDKVLLMYYRESSWQIRFSELSDSVLKIKLVWAHTWTMCVSIRDYLMWPSFCSRRLIQRTWQQIRFKTWFEVVVVLLDRRCHYVIHRSEQQRASLHYPKTTLDVRVRWLRLFLVLVKVLIMALTAALRDKIKNVSSRLKFWDEPGKNELNSLQLMPAREVNC